MRPKIATNMTLNEIEFSVHLGCSAEERSQAQTIRVSIYIAFNEPLLGCETDKLEDTFCYNAFTEKLHQHLAQQEYFLIEYLAAVIYQFGKQQLPSHQSLNIHLTKFPPVKGLSGGVTFTYGDG